MMNGVLLPGLFHKFLERAIRVDAGAGTLCHFPVIHVPHYGRKKGPLGAGRRLHGMYQALLFFIVKETKFIRACLDRKPAVPFNAKFLRKRIRGQTQETGNPHYFVLLYRDTAFSITTGAAHPAFKRLHKVLFTSFK